MTLHCLLEKKSAKKKCETETLTMLRRLRVFTGDIELTLNQRAIPMINIIYKIQTILKKNNIIYKR